MNKDGVTRRAAILAGPPTVCPTDWTRLTGIATAARLLAGGTERCL